MTIHHPKKNALSPGFIVHERADIMAKGQYCVAIENIGPDKCQLEKTLSVGIQALEIMPLVTNII